MARRECLGFDGSALPDLILDEFVCATLAITTTSHVSSASHALIAIPRSPMVVTVAAWHLQALPGGRYRPGLVRWSRTA